MDFDELHRNLSGHLQIVLVALSVGIATSVPLGTWARSRPWAERTVLGIAGVIQTIPGLALLAAMVPTLSLLGLPGLGFLPAVIALSLYSALPVLQNTITGLHGVDAALREAGLGVGMSNRQLFWRVELPLSMPVIVAGVRTATLWVVGIATIATPVGARSLGNYIFSGLHLRDTEAILIGCCAAALLALTLDGVVRLLEAGLRSRRRSMIHGALGAFALLVTYAGASAFVTAGGTQSVRIGAKSFTEQYILSEILRAHIEARTGSRSEVLQSLGSTVAFDALVAGEIDVYVDYAGTLWTAVCHRTDTPARQALLRALGQELESRHGVLVVGALGFENAYALAMRQADAEQRHIRTISDLTRIAPALRFGADYEFLARPEWRSIERTYGLRFTEQRSMDPSLMVQALVAREVDVISAYTTDGRLDALQLQLLEDNLHAIPPYDALVLGRPGLREDAPDLYRALQTLAGTIDSSDMRELNRQVDQDGRRPAEVATQFMHHQR